MKGRMPIVACGLFLCLVLAGCGDSTAPSASDQRDFDETAEMLDSAPRDLNGIDESGVADPEDSGTDENRGGS